ncbi:MAG: restriction endonuclease subunit S [Sphingomonas sp.]
MSQLPGGWAACTVHDVCELKNGRAYKQDELLDSGKYPVLRVGNFFSNRSWYYSDLELESDKYCHDNDLLYAWSASFGPKIWNGGTVIFHYHIWRVDIESTLIEKRFLFHWFEWDKENIKSDLGTGSTMIHVTKGGMEARRFVLPPIPEQRRIVAKVDGLTARTARARKELGRLPTLIARYKQRLLALSFPENAGPMAPLDELIDDALIGLVRSKQDQSDTKGIPYIRMQHYDLDGHWNSKDITRVDATSAEATRFALRKDDVIFNTRNSAELVGKVALCPEGVAGYLYNNNLLRIRFKKSILPGFAFRQMQAPIFRGHLERQKSATTSVAALYQRNLYQTPLWVPPIEQQAEIVRRIESAFSWLDRIGADHASAARLLPKLDAAILAKAFHGELAPQDPKDEPASVLLERIRAERAAEGKNPEKKRVTPPQQATSADGTFREQVIHPGQATKGAPTQMNRQDYGVKGAPYLRDILTTMGGVALPEELYRRAGLSIVHFYKQLSDEHDKGWLIDDNKSVRVA